MLILIKKTQVKSKNLKVKNSINYFDFLLFNFELNN